MGSAFVASYVQLVEGEKDPRNLLVSFSIIRVLLIEFDVTSQIEVRFSVFFSSDFVIFSGILVEPI